MKPLAYPPIHLRVAPVGDNVFLDLGFPAEEAARLKEEADCRIAEEISVQDADEEVERERGALEAEDRAVYDLGRVVWIAGVRGYSGLTRGTIVHRFQLPDRGALWHYVIEIPAPIELLLVIREWATLSETAEGSLNWRRGRAGKGRRSS